LEVRLGNPVSDENRPLSRGRFFLVWLMLGIQSFGGGSVVLAMIRRAAVEQYGWTTEAEFTRDWALIQVAPGINLIALTILLGRRVAGMTGILLALIGLLLPSALITVLITLLYSHFAERPEVRAALRGILPVTVGLGLRTSAQMALPLLRKSSREGRASFVLSVLLIVGCGAITAVWDRLPVVLLLCGSGLIAALYSLYRAVGNGVPPPALPSAEAGP
jgi:chromate transporter